MVFLMSWLKEHRRNFGTSYFLIVCSQSLHFLGTTHLGEMSWRTAVVAQPSSSRNRIESQSISLRTGPCCISSWKAQVSFILINFPWYAAYVVLFLAETWSARFRRFIFQLCQFRSCCSFSLESHFPKDLWTNFRFRKLGLLQKLLPLPIFPNSYAYPSWTCICPGEPEEVGFFWAICAT